MKQIVLKFGLISGLILVAMTYTMMAMLGDGNDFEKGETYGYLFSIFAYSMIFFGIRSYRDKISGGFINFNMGFRVGILITLIAAALYTIGWMIYFNFIDDSFIEKYSFYYIDKVSASGKPAEEIKAELRKFKANMADYRNPWVMAMYTFLEVFPIGLVVTILCAFLMRKTKSNKDSLNSQD